MLHIFIKGSRIFPAREWIAPALLRSTRVGIKLALVVGSTNTLPVGGNHTARRIVQDTPVANS